MSEFFRTQMGHRYYESTMPSLVRELSRLNTNLERLLAVIAPEAVMVVEGDGKPTSSRAKETR